MDSFYIVRITKDSIENNIDFIAYDLVNEYYGDYLKRHGAESEIILMKAEVIKTNIEIEDI